MCSTEGVKSEEEKDRRRFCLPLPTHLSPSSSTARKGLAPSRVLGAGQPLWVLCKQPGWQCCSRSGREHPSLPTASNGWVRGSRNAPRAFASLGSFSPQMLFQLPLPSPLFGCFLSCLIVHAPLTAAAAAACTAPAQPCCLLKIDGTAVLKCPGKILLMIKLCQAAVRGGVGGDLLGSCC